MNGRHAKRRNGRHVDRDHKQQQPRPKCENGAGLYKFTFNPDKSESRLMTNATMIVICSGGTYFDRDYYADVHLPLAFASWQKHGLESAAAFFPRDADAVDVSVGIYRFRDEAALHAALASAEADAVMADVPRFTDATVARMIGAPL